MNVARLPARRLTPDGKGCLWIAEKIPDGHFSVAANQLGIRAIREGDPNQIFNPKLPQMLKDFDRATYDAQGLSAERAPR